MIAEVRSCMPVFSFSKSGHYFKGDMSKTEARSFFGLASKSPGLKFKVIGSIHYMVFPKISIGRRVSRDQNGKGA